MINKQSLFSALSFLTIIRLKGYERFDAKESVYSFAYAGILIGIGAAIVHMLLPPVAVVIYLCVITGFLHLDGLADTFDGLFSHKSKDKMLEIMKDSRIGAMGAVAIVLCLLGKYNAVTNIESVLIFAAIPAFSRYVMVLMMAFLPYVRQNGTGKAFVGGYDRRVFMQILPAEIILLVACGFIGFITINLLFVAIFIWLSVWYKKSLGGITGDLLGASGEIMETVLFIAAARFC
ncbi:MAG: adenosylcobinamide-GDP ribazoletransferase [Deferribacteraceae bacterium]|jgi:adenosylcobinamide-GDP ribazoletransferase|nr:adenosylcobinamide-GDP ribazoletransferase [Deferribacteraceae bacterium]